MSLDGLKITAQSLRVLSIWIPEREQIFGNYRSVILIINLMQKYLQLAYHKKCITNLCHILSSYSLRLLSIGIVKYEVKKHLPSTEQCSIDASQKNHNDFSRIKLADLMATFVLFGTGLSLSIVAFFIEKAIWFMQ